MRLSIFTPLIILTLIASIYAADYEVTIDGQTYLFSQGIKQKIILKDGKQISVSIKGVKTKKFQDYGISFNYPSEMILSKESFFGVNQITLESTDSTLLIIQMYPAGNTPAKVQDNLLTALRKEFASFGAKSTTPCKRSLGGVMRQGVELSYTLGKVPHKNEIYTMQKNGKTIAFMFQYAEEDKEKASPRFKTITQSFK